jgi:hypothetical protein
VGLVKKSRNLEFASVCGISVVLRTGIVRNVGIVRRKSHALSSFSE